MRLVVDTNVVVSALLWGGIPRQLLDAIHQRRATAFASGELIPEYDEKGEVTGYVKDADAIRSKFKTGTTLSAAQKFGMDLYAADAAAAKAAATSTARRG